MKKGDFFRTFDGPNRYQFGRCREITDDRLTVEWFGKGEPRYGLEPVPYRVTYFVGSMSHNRFLEIAEIWP